MPVAPWYRPALQWSHVLMRDLAWNWPAAHGVHRGASASEKVPAAQALHSVPSVNSPARHTMSEQEVAPVPRAVEPAAHAVHTLAPAAEYVPDAHATQILAPAAAAK